VPDSLEEYASELEYKLVRAAQSSVKIMLLKPDGKLIYKSSTLSDKTAMAISSLISASESALSPGDATPPQFIPAISDDQFFIYRATKYLFIVVFSTGVGITELYKRQDILEKYGHEISDNFIAPPVPPPTVTIRVSRKKPELQPEVIEAIREQIISAKAVVKTLQTIAERIYEKIDALLG